MIVGRIPIYNLFLAAVGFVEPSTQLEKARRVTFKQFGGFVINGNMNFAKRTAMSTSP